jgi:hypothetical protein
MKDESSARANDVLRRLRGSADPRPQDEARVLARVEQRLGMISELEAFRVPAARRVNAGTPGGTRSAGVGAPLQRLLGAAPRVGLWAAFGVSMAAIGYGLGTRGVRSREVRQDVAEVTRAPAAEAAPAAFASAAAPAPAPAIVPVPVVIPAPAPPPAVVPVPAVVPASAIPASAIPASAISAPVVVPPPAPGPLSERPRSPNAAARSAARNEGLSSESLVAPAAAVAPSAAVAAEPDSIGLREALQLLERAQAAVRLGTAGDALDWLAQLERRNPGVLLEQERLVTRALALCALGEVAQARDARRQLERLEPESIYRGQLDASCARKE